MEPTLNGGKGGGQQDMARIAPLVFPKCCDLFVLGCQSDAIIARDHTKQYRDQLDGYCKHTQNKAPIYVGVLCLQV